jgi:hypothetical protein
VKKVRSYELTITVQPDGGIIAKNDEGKEKEGKLDLDPLRRATIGVFEKWLRRDLISDRNELEVLGTHLYQSLFDDRLEDFLKDELRAARSEKKRLRLQLKLDKAEEILASYPWEFLYYPEDEEFLALHVNLVLFRYMTPPDDQNPVQSKLPLKILLAVSRPADQKAVVSANVVQSIKDMEQSWSINVIKVEVIENPTRSDLRRKLESFVPHVFHFMGPNNSEGKIALLLEPGGKETDWCDDKALLGIFRQALALSSLRLLFLQMCKDKDISDEDAELRKFSGFAPLFVRAGVPAVVAMQYAIGNEDARNFNLAFYPIIFDSGSVDEAVQKGRYRVTNETSRVNSRVFGSPVLYMYRSDCVIMPVTEIGQPGKEKPAGGIGSNMSESVSITGGKLSESKLVDKGAIDTVGNKP